MNCLGDSASLTDDLATPAKPAAAVFDDGHLLGPVTASTAQHGTSAETHGPRVAAPAAGAQRTETPSAPAVVRGIVGVDEVFVGVRPAAGRM